MAIKSEFYDTTCVLQPDGDLTVVDTPGAKTLVEEAVDLRQVVDFIVDFEHCPFVDSDGLELLLWLKRRAEDLFGRLKLVNLDENVAKILEITRLARRFDCPGDLGAGLKAMR